MEYEIYFSDLNEDAQKELLEAVKIEDPREMNWDILPIATCFVGDENE